ncbi:hypothetical protein Sjap_025320 [Stephania japonica]|uniref:Gnk2-homologous domain-containing protein n=1 Tax=Stephania japonica TaxID=461633 RepID=A0AAP0E9C5_9MAGN
MSTKPSAYHYQCHTVNSPNTSNEVLENFLNSLVDEASASSSSRNGGSPHLFYTKEARFGSLLTIYGLVQCTPDITSPQCRDCLGVAIALIPISSCLATLRGNRLFLNCAHLRMHLLAMQKKQESQLWQFSRLLWFRRFLKTTRLDEQQVLSEHRVEQARLVFKGLLLQRQNISNKRKKALNYTKSVAAACTPKTTTRARGSSNVTDAQSSTDFIRGMRNERKIWGGEERKIGYGAQRTSHCGMGFALDLALTKGWTIIPPMDEPIITNLSNNVAVLAWMAWLGKLNTTDRRVAKTMPELYFTSVVVPRL